MFEELGDSDQRVVKICRVVEHHDHARSQRRLCFARAFERQRHVERRGTDERAGCAAKQNRLQRAAVRNAAGQLNRFAKRTPAFDLVQAGFRDVTRETEQPRPGRARCSGHCPRGPALVDDVEHVYQRLDVIDDRRFVEQSRLCRKWRLRSRLASLAFNRIEQRRFLTADIRAAAAADLEIERKA